MALRILGALKKKLAPEKRPMSLQQQLSEQKKLRSAANAERLRFEAEKQKAKYKTPKQKILERNAAKTAAMRIRLGELSPVEKMNLILPLLREKNAYVSNARESPEEQKFSKEMQKIGNSFMDKAERELKLEALISKGKNATPEEEQERKRLYEEHLIEMEEEQLRDHENTRERMQSEKLQADFKEIEEQFSERLRELNRRLKNKETSWEQTEENIRLAKETSKILQTQALQEFNMSKKKLEEEREKNL